MYRLLTPWASILAPTLHSPGESHPLANCKTLIHIADAHTQSRNWEEAAFTFSGGLGKVVCLAQIMDHPATTIEPFLTSAVSLTLWKLPVGCSLCESFTGDPAARDLKAGHSNRKGPLVGSGHAGWGTMQKMTNFQD